MELPQSNSSQTKFDLVYEISLKSKMSDFFGPPTLTVYSFSASLAMMMNRSFESPKPYLFALNFKKQDSSTFKVQNFGSD